MTRPRPFLRRFNQSAVLAQGAGSQSGSAVAPRIPSHLRRQSRARSASAAISAP